MVEIQLELTNKCYLNCLHCSSNASVLHQKSKNYNLTDMKRFLKGINGNKICYLTGGEPLVADDFNLIVDELSESDVNIGIFTSGILSSDDGAFRPIKFEYAEKLKVRGVTSCYISLYSHKKETHEQITQVNDSFNLTIESINSMVKAHIDTKIHIVINKLNYTDIVDTIKYLETIGVTEVRLLRIVNNGRAKSSWDLIGLPLEMQTELINKILSIKDEFKINITVSGLPKITPCRPLGDSKGCEAGVKLYYINHDGNVYPCACTRSKKNYCLGNLSDAVLENCIKNISNDDCLNPPD